MNPIQPTSNSHATEDCPDGELNPPPPAASGPAAGPPGPAPPAVPEPTASRRSRFLEKVYYWVLSRS
jgi:hypothetical protein